MTPAGLILVRRLGFIVLLQINSNKMKTLLVIPPVGENQLSVQTDAVLSRCAGIILKSHYVLPPIGVMYLAAALMKWSDAEVHVLDCMVEGIDETASTRRIKAISPDLLFFTLGTPSIDFARGWISRIRQALSEPHE